MNLRPNFSIVRGAPARIPGQPASRCFYLYDRRAGSMVPLRRAAREASDRVTDLAALALIHGSAALMRLMLAASLVVAGMVVEHFRSGR